MIRPNRTMTRAARSLGLAGVLVGLAATPALAAPQLGVELERDRAVVSHSDERLVYTATVSNVAPKTQVVDPGDTLTCDANDEVGNWNNEPSSFSFQWLSNGAPAVGTSEQPTPTTGTYVAQSADEGHALQCVVRGSNAFGATASFSQPVVVSPVPSPAPPAYSGEGALRPTVVPADQSPDERTCTPPGNWTGSPTWSYQWLRNGVPIPGATAGTYLPKAGPGEEDELKALQCMVIGETGSGEAPTGGAIVAISSASLTALTGEFDSILGGRPPINREAATEMPFIVDPNTATGTVTLQLELPGGEETFAYQASGQGWSCDRIPASGAQHAMAACTRADALAPGESYPSVKVIAGLGADAPDLAVAKATAFGGGATTPVSTVNEFTFEPLREFGLIPGTFSAALFDDEGHEYTQAGGHPFMGVGVFKLATKRTLTDGPGGGEINETTPVEHVKQVIVDLPRGQVGNTLAVPELCEQLSEVKDHLCPPGSVVGKMHLVVRGAEAFEPIYAIEPEFGAAAQFAFNDAVEGTYTLSARLRPEDAYAVSLEVSPPPKIDFLESKATICDFGIKPPIGVGDCKKAGEPGANPLPLFTMPTRCGKPAPVTKVRLRSWEHPEIEKTESFTNAEITGCEKVDFEPTMNLAPTSHQADSPTGLDVNLSMPTEGLEGKDDEGNIDPEAVAQANLKRAEVTFPQGMAINPTAGQGLGSCSKEEIKLGTNEPIACPDSSKIGSVEIDTPVLEETLKGDVFIAKQGEVEGSLIGFYLVFDSKKDGILVKIPAKVTPDPNTGQLTVTVAESPEQPFSAVRMHFPGGPRATLLTPPKCGSYEITSELTPWSGQAPVTETSSFEVNQGPNGGPCPTGGLDATLTAGSANPLAGQTTPFNVRLTRPDGSDRFTALGLHLPPGLTAYLKGVPYCPEASIAQAKSREVTGQGQAEIDNPSCPAASQVGKVIARAGAGDNPLYVDTGKAYLAGPYKGAPLSIVAIAPAVAGPLDLGAVVVRNALKINPKTAEVDVISDPIPTILHGVLLDIRDVRVQVDRPSFTLNPTDCEAKQVKATVSGLGGGSANLSNGFQVGGCESLGFKPNLKTRLFGGTHRGDFPRFQATYKPKQGDANLEDLLLRFPRSEFIEQGHFRTICTRVQYAAGAGLGSECPKGSIYGHIEAVTPLLDEPLSGPVYLRSSDHNLPDVVFALHGQVDAEAAVRIDSVKGGLRASLEDAPDVPLTKVVLNMQGKDKGLFVNSRDVCASSNKATLKAEAHNGREFESKPVLRNSKCGAARKGGKRKHSAHGRATR